MPLYWGYLQQDKVGDSLLNRQLSLPLKTATVYSGDSSKTVIEVMSDSINIKLICIDSKQQEDICIPNMLFVCYVCIENMLIM